MGFYEVSNFGLVRNKRSKKIIIGDVNNCGYHRICFCDKKNNRKERVFVHRLVYKTFYHLNEFKDDGMVINHIDGDKSNNNLNNLEAITQLENERHSRIVLKSKPYKPFFVKFDNEIIKKYQTKKEFSNEINVTTTCIKYWLHKKNKGYKKYNIKEIYYIQE